MEPMDNFREFEAGPDPFGRSWHVLFKYLQTAISIRHSDSVDICFALSSGEEQVQKTIVLANPDVRAFARKHPDHFGGDTWCSRVAMLKLRRAAETFEDFDKDYIHVTAGEFEEFDAAIREQEAQWVKTHAA